MKTFQQFISEAYPKSERKSHQPRLSFRQTLDQDSKSADEMAPMPQIGPADPFPRYIPDYKGPVYQNDRGPHRFAKPTNKGKVTKRIHTNMPIQTGPYKKADNLTL
jgi:hypothetical protein